MAIRVPGRSRPAANRSRSTIGREQRDRARRPKPWTPKLRRPRLLMAPGSTNRIATPRTTSVPANQTDELALDLHPFRSEDAGLVGWVRGFERDRGATTAEALQGRFLLVDQGHDDVARIGRVLLLDHDEVPVEDAGLDHRVAPHLERIMLALGKE